MHFQAGLLFLFLLALVFAPYVKASTKNTDVSILSDDSTGRGDAVALPSSSVLIPNTNTTSLVQTIPGEDQVSEMDEQTRKFEELIKKKQYKKIVELGEMSDKELLKCLSQVVISLDQFKGIYKYLKQRSMVPNFLAHGKVAIVKKVIVESNILETNRFGGCDSIYDAIAISLNEDHHERVAGLLEAARGRPNRMNKFDWFVKGFFDRHSPEENSMPLKRFLTLHGEEFGKKYPATFEAFCGILVERLKMQLDNPDSHKLLIDLIGQPSLLSPAAFAKGFLYFVNDPDPTILAKYGYKEAIEEGLKGEHRGGGMKLWNVLMRTLPNQFSETNPSADEARALPFALKNFKTKQDREEEWAKENAPILRMKLEEFVPDLFPLFPLTIISEYAITWISLLPSPLQKHSTSANAQGVVTEMSNKLLSEETTPDGIAAQPKAVQKDVDRVTKPLSTKKQPLEDIVDCSGLSNIDPYDNNRHTKYYLDLGCGYLAKTHAKKYETGSVQGKQKYAYYTDCLRAVWPGSSFKALLTSQCRLKDFVSFKKGDVLTQPFMQPPSLAHEDGFVLQLTMDCYWMVYYHKDKPPMELDVLSRLHWPHDRDLLPFADTYTKTVSAQLRKLRPNQFDATIKLNSKHVRSVKFADLKHWVQSFDLTKYDPVLLRVFREELSLKYPGISLSKIHSVGKKTSVEPLYNPFVLISPGKTIAYRYDPQVFTLPEEITNTRCSTIIADFEHQGTKYCLVLSFEVPLNLQNNLWSNILHQLKLIQQ